MTIAPPDLDKLDELPAVFEAGCSSFKLYMAYDFRLDDGQLLQALEAVRDVGGLPVVHAENWDVICTLVERNLAQGRIEPRWHPRSRPALTEGEAAGRLIDLATLAGTPVHIFHVSCASVIERIAAARQRGLPVTGETCPQYLLLTDELFDRPGVDGTLPVCSPPLRTESDQEQLWTALANDTLQLVTTDHCPFTRADKATGLQQGRFSVNRWVDICCTTPARFLGFEKKGAIIVGHDADLVIFDPERTVTLSTETLHENVDWTPYAGLAAKGWPAVTISRGQILVENGEFLGQAGQGQFVRRTGRVS
jgi:dihydropyrimidinase